tara:strand:- start:11 stop:3838 length:3828 start_codon:yes stop_codon:yes gene_type:complete
MSSDIQDPCEIQQPAGSTPASNNPRQGFIEGIREAAAADPEFIVTVENPSEQDLPTNINVGGGGVVLNPPLDELRPPVEAEDPTKSKFVLHIENYAEAETFARGPYLIDNLGKYPYSPPVFGDYFFEGVINGSPLYQAHREYFGLLGREGSYPYPYGSSACRYSRSRTWGSQAPLPLYAPSFERCKFDIFRYVSGKHWSYFDDGSKAVGKVALQRLSYTFRFANSTPNFIPRMNFPATIANYGETTRATIRKVTALEDSSMLRSYEDIPEAAELLSSPEYFGNEFSDRIKLDTILEKFVIDCENFETRTRPMQPSRRVLSDNIQDEAPFSKVVRPIYQQYMKAGWSWRNYFYGFYPLYSRRHDDIKYFRQYISDPLVPLTDAFHHPNDKLMGLMDSRDRYNGQQNVYNAYGAEQNTIFDISEQGDDKRKLGVDDSYGYVEKYSENIFPVIPFWGERYYPDEVSIEDAEQHLHIKEDPLFQATLTGQSNSYYTLKTNFINKLNDSPFWSAIREEENSAYNSFFSPHASNRVRPPRVGKDAVFYDLVFSMPVFATKKDLESNDQPISAYVKAEGKYNYYDEFYEKNILANIVDAEDIRSLPDPYSFDFEDYQSDGGHFSFRLDLNNGNIAGTTWARYPNYDGLSNRVVEDYNIPPSPLPSVQVFGNNKVISENFKNKYQLRNMSPMIIDFELKQKTKNLLTDTLNMQNKVDFSTPLFDAIGAIASQQNQKDATILNSTDLLSNTEDRPDYLRYSGYQTEGQIVQDPTENSKIDILKLNDWLENVHNSLLDTSKFTNYFERVNASFGFLLTRAKIEDFVKKNARTFDDIMSGKPAHSEIVGYKVEKYKVVEASEDPLEEAIENEEFIQSKYFSSTNEDDLLKYFDSQVDYGTTYRLKIKTVLLVVGNKYAYLDVMNRDAIRKFNFDGRVILTDSIESAGSSQDRDQFREAEAAAKLDIENYEGDNPKMFFGVLNKPEVFIAEVHDKTMNITVLDKPPIPPDVEVIPYKGVKNKILFNINSMTGEMFSKPVLLDDEDGIDYLKIAANQGLDPMKVFGATEDNSPTEDSLIHFKNDDLTLQFQIFRVEEEPKTLEIFKDNLIANIDKGKPSATFIDDISPNKKYWYTFRTRDIHGHLSMPSNIYQVEIVSDGEVMYAISDIFKIKKQTEEFASIPMQQFIRIKPAMLQTQMDLMQFNNYTEWAANGKRLGVSNHPIWGKRFVIKIKSKNTGKEAHIRIKFNRKDAIVDSEGIVTFTEIGNAISQASIRGVIPNGGFDFGE